MLKVNLTPAQLAEHLQFKLLGADEGEGWSGPNLMEHGAREDGFIMRPDYTAFDRSLNKAYTREEFLKGMGFTTCLRGICINSETSPFPSRQKQFDEEVMRSIIACMYDVEREIKGCAIVQFETGWEQFCADRGRAFARAIYTRHIRRP